MQLGVARMVVLPGRASTGMAAAAQVYQEAEVTDGGTIRGKGVYNGRVPSRTILPTKDQEVCGQLREEPEVILGPDGGVQDSIVYLEDVEQGKPWSAETEKPTLESKD